jgi:hypothetical protein
MNQYYKILKVLTGGDLLPTSPKQCVQYFHDLLEYKVVGYTDTGQPSLDEKGMLKLKLSYPDNLALDFCLAFRHLSKESGSLKFSPWKE